MSHSQQGCLGQKIVVVPLLLLLALICQVKDYAAEQVQQLVPNLVTAGIVAHVPPMIDEVCVYV